MKAINRKLWRDLWHLRSQVVTVALVVGSAFSGFAGSLATYHSLVNARDDFYASARFAHVFSDIKRAPLAIEPRILEVPGVGDAETTIVYDATLDLPGVALPIVGRLVALPLPAETRLNRLVIRRGRSPEPEAVDEVVVSEGFAATRGLQPGDAFPALINGRRQSLRVVGIGLSPEYIYATRGGAFPDDRSFGVLWIGRQGLAAATNMEGAFNHVSIRLAPGASERAVIDGVDRLLAPYGGRNAYGRDEQLSHRILSQEINQWKVIGTVIPTIFLAVAAFLLNVVLHRQVAIQRGEIAALKALGYGNGAIARHYLAQVAVICAIGIVVGLGVGFWFGEAVTGLYARFFHFPSYRFEMPVGVALAALAVTLAAAIGGALSAVRAAARMAPAEAMRPPFPEQYRPTLVERAGLQRLLSPAMRMTLRNVERRPLRSALTTLGMAAALAIIVSGLFWRDALDYMIDVQFEAAQPADVLISLVEARDARAGREVAALPGVLMTEGSRDVPVRLVAGHRYYRTVVQGLPAASELRRPLDAALARIPMPATGLLLTDRLAARLGVVPGDTVSVEILEGDRRVRDVPVAGTVHDLIGLFAYMNLGALNRMLGEGDAISGVAAVLDGNGGDAGDALFRRLKDYPRVATVASKFATMQNFRETSARNILFFTGVLTAFAVVIAVGVVYNNARIALQERAWELASLRVLGFTRGEVSTFLLGELALELMAAIPLGCAMGYALSWVIVRMSHSDMIAIPVIVEPRTYAFAAIAIVAAGCVSALIVRRRIDTLDLVAVLKTRE